MKDLMKHVEIGNFKSIKHLELDDCKRINLFVGYPNVGKSNIIEALSLFSVPYLNEGDNLNKLIRAENKFELFFDAKIDTCFVTDGYRTAEFKTNSSFVLRHEDIGTGRQFFFSPKLNLSKHTNSNIDDGEDCWHGNVKKYTFNANQNRIANNELSLLPPYGENLIDVLTNNINVAEVKVWIKQELKKFGLEYVIDKADNSLKVQRRLNDDEVLQFPWSSVADTLQRIIFYKTAIASNADSVLLFEEPEAHAFPPYIRTVTNDIAGSKSNQFFITTHSPVIVNEFIEDAEICKELAIYIVDFKNGETTVKRLMSSDLDEIFSNGIDLFFDLERYLD
jgi:AAA15 family ATPase/GTPase